MHSSANTPGTLYVVGTPIGNLGDTSVRMKETLQQVDAIACEDTRVTARLLQHLGIHKPMVSYRDDNEIRAAESLLQRLLQGEHIALVSDAGVPTISDPGFRITRLCQKQGIPVLPIPGPCALITALSASGLPSDSFLFLGFLLPKKAARIRTFTQYLDFPHTLLFYESPHRITKCLDDMKQVLEPERVICVSKELTKMHERIVSGSLSDVHAHVLSRSLKGEFVVGIAPRGFVL
ncbi:MAG: 16S rRNA (cytidine(1402)-2'-O)-methyltransferase [Puniceicoccaceae bacterium]